MFRRLPDPPTTAQLAAQPQRRQSGQPTRGLSAEVLRAPQSSFLILGFPATEPFSLINPPPLPCRVQFRKQVDLRGDKNEEAPLSQNPQKYVYTLMRAGRPSMLTRLRSRRPVIRTRPATSGIHPSFEPANTIRSATSYCQRWFPTLFVVKFQLTRHILRVSQSSHRPSLQPSDSHHVMQHHLRCRYRREGWTLP